METTEEIARREQPGKELLQKLTKTAADTQKQLRDFKTVQELQRPIQCKVYRATTQSLTSGAYPTNVSFSNASYDTDTHWVIGDPTKITIIYAGVYHCVANVDISYNATGSRLLEIRVNNTHIIASCDIPATSDGGTNVRLSCSCDVILAVGDYVQLSPYQNAGVALNTNPVGVHMPSLSIRRVSK